MVDGNSKYQIRLTASDETRAAFDSVKENIGGMEAPLSSIQSAFASIGATAAAAMVLSFAKSSIAAAEEANQAMLKLQAIYKSTGGVIGFTTNELNKMADAMAETTHFDDEAIRNGMSEIIKFGNVTGKVFKDSLQVIADYAAFSGQEFPEAASAVARALADPETAAKLLKQAGVILTEQQKDLIRTLKETGDEAGAQQIVLERLQGAYKGMEETMNGGLTGATKSLGKEWAELMEGFGKSSAGAANQVLGSVAFSIRNLREAIAEAEAQDQKRIQNSGRFASMQISKPGGSDTGPLAGKTLEDLQAAARETASTMKTASDQQDAVASKALKKLLENVAKFEADLAVSHDSAFDKTVKKYVAMEAELTKIGSVGLEDKKALQEKFSIFLTEEHNKRTAEIQAAFEKEEEINSKIISAQQEKFMRMSAQANEASSTGEERENIRYEEKLRELERDRQVLEDKHLWDLESESKYQAAMAALKKQHQSNQMKSDVEMVNFGRSIKAGEYTDAMSMAAKMTAGIAGHSRAAFEINKVASIASAIMNTYRGVAGVLGEFPGPWGWAMAAVQAAMGFAQVDMINATQFGGGGSSAGGGGVPSMVTAPGIPVAPQQGTPQTPIPVTGVEAQAPRTVNLIMSSSDSAEFYSAQTIRELLIPALNEAAGDGVIINVVTS